MAVSGVSDAELGRRLGVSRQAAHARRTGRMTMTLPDIMEAAEALDVDPSIFLGPPSAALMWLAEHRREQLDALESGTGRQGELSERSERSRCTAPRLTFLTHRSRMDYDRGAVVRAA